MKDSSPRAVPRRILPVIIIAEFAATSLWFATNAVMPELQQLWMSGLDVVGLVTSSVQIGFILGTLCFAYFTVADRYSPRLLFFFWSVLGALCNSLLLFTASNFPVVLLLRVSTGICLAGIYPIGMKIASGWYHKGLGNALGYLVGALVLGTAFPHFIRSVVHGLEWVFVLQIVSIVTAAGGILMLLFVPDGPHLIKGAPFNSKALPIIFRSKELRAAALGYFGHMWELYTFYTFVPVVIAAYAAAHALESINVSWWTFIIIGAGSLGCAGGGILSKRVGSARVAWTQLLCSGLLCLVSPLLFSSAPALFLASLVVWGVVVVGDSPQFSTLIARYAPRELVGSALTIGNSIGFAITIVSIQTVSTLSHILQPPYLFTILAIGPLLGLIASRRLLKTEPIHS